MLVYVEDNMNNNVQQTAVTIVVGGGAPGSTEVVTKAAVYGPYDGDDYDVPPELIAQEEAEAECADDDDYDDDGECVSQTPRGYPFDKCALLRVYDGSLATRHFPAINVDIDPYDDDHYY
jgi:hypothetical protein